MQGHNVVEMPKMSAGLEALCSFFHITGFQGLKGILLAHPAGTLLVEQDAICDIFQILRCVYISYHFIIFHPSCGDSG